MALTFEGVGVDSFRRFERRIISSEECYPLHLRSEKEDYLEILRTPSSVGLVAFEGSDYVGNAIGCPLTDCEKEEYGISPDCMDRKVFYLFNIVITPAHQGKGYSSVLLKEFLKHVRTKGYDMIAGHYRMNGSLALMKKAGATELRVHEDWEGTGESFVFCELDLTEAADQTSA